MHSTPFASHSWKIHFEKQSIYREWISTYHHMAQQFFNNLRTSCNGTIDGNVGSTVFLSMGCCAKHLVYDTGGPFQFFTTLPSWSSGCGHCIGGCGVPCGQPKGWSWWWINVARSWFIFTTTTRGSSLLENHPTHTWCGPIQRKYIVAKDQLGDVSNHGLFTWLCRMQWLEESGIWVSVSIYIHEASHVHVSCVHIHVVGIMSCMCMIAYLLTYAYYVP